MIKLNKNGFTILELMIATMVFSVILLLAANGIVQIGRNYYRGVLQSRTQETARNIIDEISRGIQFSGDAVVTTIIYSADPAYPGNGGRYGFCINNRAYSYFINRQLVSATAVPDLNQRRQGLVAYDESCNGYATVVVPALAINPALYANPKELLGIGMSLTELNVEDLGNSTYRITVSVASGELELFDLNGVGVAESCKGGDGSQFCAISKLSTIVQKRVK